MQLFVSNLYVFSLLSQLLLRPFTIDVERVQNVNFFHKLLAQQCYASLHPNLRQVDANKKRR